MNSTAEAVCQDSLPDQEKGSLPACWGLYKCTSGGDLHVSLDIKAWVCFLINSLLLNNRNAGTAGVVQQM